MGDLKHIKSQQLASMLARENISLNIDPNAPTAMFDPATRHLTLPAWNLDSQVLTDVLVMHEVGHALYSPKVPECDPVMKGFLNVLEDVRVDKLQRRAYPGSKRDYFLGYKEILDAGIFGDPSEYPTMQLADRINLKSKLGNHVSIPFYTEEEVSFLNRAFATETFDEVVALAKELYDYEVERAEKGTQATENDEAGDTDGEASEGKTPKEIGQATAGDGDTKKQAEAGNKPSDANGDATADDVDSDVTGSDTEEHDAEGSDSDSEPSDTSKESSSAKGTEGSDGNSDGDGSVKPQAPQTADAINDLQERSASAYKRLNPVGNRFKRILVGGVTPEAALANREMYMEQVKGASKLDSTLFDTVQTAYRRNELKARLDAISTLEKDIRPAVAALSKEFAVRKQARVQASLVTNRGSLDTDRLHLYRITDDVFEQRVQVTRNEENHRLVFLVDFSYSMFQNGGLRTVMKQLAVFRRFCLNEGIPFQVFSFTTFPMNDGVFNEETKQIDVYPEIVRLKTDFMRRNSDAFSTKAKGMGLDEVKAKAAFTGNVKMTRNDREYEIALATACVVEILNERDSDEYFNDLYAYWTVAYDIPAIHDRALFNMGNTPLNDALDRMYQYMINLKAHMIEDKLNFILLTDGEATDWDSANNNVVVNQFSKREYTNDDLLEETGEGRCTSKLNYGLALLKELKEMGVLHSIVWYNYTGHVGYDINWHQHYHTFGKNLLNELKKRAGVVNDWKYLYTVNTWTETELNCKKGFIKFDKLTSWLDTVIFYKAEPGNERSGRLAKQTKNDFKRLGAEGMNFKKKLFTANVEKLLASEAARFIA